MPRRADLRSARLRTSLLVAALGAAAIGCGGGSDDADPSTTGPAAPTTPASTAPADSTSPDRAGDDAVEPAERAPTTSDEGSVLPASTLPDRSISWLPPVALVTEPGDDPRPLLAWEAVSGAERYSVVVHTVEGRPYWAWDTTSTSVHLGGDPRLDDEQRGPSAAPGMRWSVIAFDVDGGMIAASIDAVLRP